MVDGNISIEKSTNVRVSIFRWVMSALSRIAPGLAARLAQRLFLTPIASKAPARESDWAEDAHRTTIPFPLGALPVWVWGDGPETVVLVHGWGGRGLQLGSFARPLVQRGFRVVTFDAPGHGESSSHTSSLPAFAAALGAVSRRFGPVSAVVAHSLGSAATVFALAQRELMVDRVVAIAPAARLHAIRKRFGRMTGFTAPVIDRMRAAFEERYGFDWEASEPLRVAPTMSMPIMVIHDSEDRLTPLSEGSDLANAWLQGRLISTTGLGHHRILRDPDVISAAVSFISEPIAQTHQERRAS